MREPRMCLDVGLSPAEQIKASANALKETHFNAPDPAALMDVSRSLSHPEAAVLLTGKRWAVGRTITVSFMDGDGTLQAKVREQAEKWLEFANLKLKWVDSGGEIRISFARGGSWSYIGTDCLTIPKDRPTMQFGWLTPTTDPVEIRRVVIHEFGHALGLGHEHSSPDARIPWDKEAAYAYYQRTQGWSRAEVDAQVFQRYSTTQTQYTAFDPTSIMEYAVDNALTTGDYQIGMNTDLSPMDRKFVSEVYPYPKEPDPEEPKPENPNKERLRLLRGRRNDIVERIEGRKERIKSLWGDNRQDRKRLKAVTQRIKELR